MTKMPKSCPACSTRLVVTGLSCPNCGTEVRGRFEFDLFSQLSPSDFDFVVMFLKAKGNIKEMERELGISYWTIRSKLSEIVAQLGLEGGEAEAPEPGETVAARRQAILDQLSAGLIGVEDAADQLEKLKKKRGN
jgi:hypothetical protein